jgi:predicted regulator of Ras-like GTPase activity (Roadblock/LC7/MglB family)
MSDLHAGSRSDRLDRAIHSLLAQTPEIEAAAVVSFDGLPMASALPPSMDEDRVAAMSAALLSLGERAAQGLGRGELSQVYIEGETGTVFLVSADNEAVLVAVAAQGAKVGMMLYEVRRAAAAVADALRADDAEVAPAHEPVLQAVQTDAARAGPAGRRRAVGDARLQPGRRLDLVVRPHRLRAPRREPHLVLVVRPSTPPARTEPHEA